MSSKITAIEVLMGIPPIDFYCSSIEIKFLIKAVNNDGICPFCRIPLCRKHVTFCRIFFGKVGIEIRQSGQGSCLHLQKQTFKAIK